MTPVTASAVLSAVGVCLLGGAGFTLAAHGIEAGRGGAAATGAIIFIGALVAISWL